MSPLAYRYAALPASIALVSLPPALVGIDAANGIMYRKMPRPSFSTALFGLCVTLPMRPSGKSGAEVHASKSPLKITQKAHPQRSHSACTLKKEIHVHDDDENTSRPRSLDSSPLALASLSNYTRLVRTDMSPFERPLRPRGTAATTRPTPRAPAAFGGWRSSATPRTAAWLQLERLVEGLRQCVSRYHI